MTKKGIPESFQLQQGERILMQECIIGGKYVGFMYFISFLIGSFNISITLLYLSGFKIFIILFTLILTLLFFIFGVMMWDNLNYLYQYSLSITNERVIMLSRKGFLHSKSKIDELQLKNIEFVVKNEEEIIIVEKSLNREPYFKGTEKEFKGYPNGVKSLDCYFSSKKLSMIKEKILNILIELLNAEKHPNLPEVYISTK